jgi:hypothetical protein
MDILSGVVFWRISNFPNDQTQVGAEQCNNNNPEDKFKTDITPDHLVCSFIG